MTTATREQTSSGVDLQRLSLVLKIQAILFLLYGLGWFFIPNTILESVFNFTELPATIHTRLFGAAFLGIAVIEYLADRRLSDHLDIVWGFALVPALIFIVFVIEFNNVKDLTFFFWSSVIITLILALGVGFLRYQANSE